MGYVQKVTVGEDDTMPDIARRFDVGYEEILLANPGVDAWLPGVGREVVVPTQFVLPAAPHKGVGLDKGEHFLVVHEGRLREIPKQLEDLTSASQRAAGELAQDERMAEHRLVKEQAGKPTVGDAQMVDPDGGIY